MTPQQVLQTYFGHESFRPGQLEIIGSILAGHDTIAILPTGSGKSLCYQIPCLLFPGCTIVISPLIALMKDQVDALVKIGVKAAYINSSLDPITINRVFTLFTKGEYNILYVSPELIQTARFQQSIHEMNISLVVIDEAHCVSDWGNSFRPSYHKIAAWFSILKNRPVIAAFTATATESVTKNIITHLDLHAPVIFQQSFRRHNLDVFVRQCHEHYERDMVLLRILKKHHQESGLIYCATREKTEELTEVLSRFGFSCAAYHAGLSSTQRSAVQDHFLHNRVPIVIATSAFGMGIDKPDIRFVVHYQPALNMREYYQEIGRAGRDGKQAQCYFLWWQEDLKILRQLSQEYGPLMRFARGTMCRTLSILWYFGETFAEKNCGHCDICIKWRLQLSQEEQTLASHLLALRKTLAREKSCIEAETVPLSVMNAIVLLHPKTDEEFLHIPGVGKGWTKDYAHFVKDAVWYNSPS